MRVTKSAREKSVRHDSSMKRGKNDNSSVTESIKSKKRKKFLKWTLITLALVALYFSFSWLLQQTIHLLQLNSTTWALYNRVSDEIASRSLTGLFYASAFGAVFFITLPVELIFIYYLGLNYPATYVIAITLLGNLLGMSFNYIFGLAVGTKFLKWLLKGTYHSFHRKIMRAGDFLVLVGNIIPFPIEPFVLFLGAVRYGFFRMVFLTVIGKLIKFILLWLAYVYFIKFFSPYIGYITLHNFISLIKSGFG